MHSEGYGNRFVCMVSSVHGYSGATGYWAACERYQWLQNEILRNKKGNFPEMSVFRRHGVKTREENLYMLLTTFIQLCRWTYLLPLR